MVRRLLAGGECPDRGLWWRELKEANKPSSWPKYTKMVSKTASFQYFFGILNCRKHLFAQKCLIRYTSKMFLEGYINVKICCHLRRCGVIPVQSLGVTYAPAIWIRVNNVTSMKLSLLLSYKYWRYLRPMVLDPLKSLLHLVLSIKIGFRKFQNQKKNQNKNHYSLSF